MSFLDLSITNKIKLSVLCGCDYLDNLRGIGFGKLIDIFSEFNVDDTTLEMTIKEHFDK